MKKVDSGPAVRAYEAAIRAKCLDCMGGSRKLVKECRTRACSLWPYREGTGKAASASCDEKEEHL